MRCLLYFSFYLCITATCYANDPESDRLKQLLKEGNKVYVSSDQKIYKTHVEYFLKEGCWTITNHKDSADFILRIKAIRSFVGEFVAYAVIVDPKTNEELYTTSNTNTLARMTFHAKKAVFNKLIRRKIVVLCNPDYISKIAVSENYTKRPISSIADELKKLKELLDSGALTQEEYDTQKKKLLNQ